MSNIILGIDPGSRNTGYAVLAEENSSLQVLRCDVLRLDDLDDHSERLQRIFETLSQLVKSIQPTSCAIETPVYGVDPLAMLKLGRAQAAAMLAFTNAGFEVTEYYPKEVKKSITGNGNADKQQVAFMLKRMVKLPEENVPNDATDALAVAWCHLMKLGQADRGAKTDKKRHQNNKKSSWADFVAQNPDRVRGK